MNIEYVLNLISTITGFIGTYFMGKGILAITPDVMAKLSQTCVGYNPEQIKNIAAQKSDMLSGFALILIAFLVQLLVQIFIRRFNIIWTLMIAVICSVLILAIVFPLNSKYSEQQQLEVRKELVKYDINDLFKNHILIDERAGADIKHSAVFLFGKARKEKGVKTTLDELCDYLGIGIPKEYQDLK